MEDTEVFVSKVLFSVRLNSLGFNASGGGRGELVIGASESPSGLSFQFEKVSSGGVIEANYVLNTERNTPEAEQKIYSEVLRGVKSMTLSLLDISGQPVSLEFEN